MEVEVHLTRAHHLQQFLHTTVRRVQRLAGHLRGCWRHIHPTSTLLSPCTSRSMASVVFRDLPRRLCPLRVWQQICVLLSEYTLTHNGNMSRSVLPA
jgi:hypothetical protein